MNQLLFTLKENVKNPRWQLRNRGVRIPREIDGENVGLREIQFVPGASSIWKEENSVEGEPESIWFTDGSLTVDPNDKVKIEFLKAHTDFGVKFELFDPEAKAQHELKQFEETERATELLREVADNEDKMAATAVSIFGVTAMNWGVSTAKMRCFNYAREKPSEVIATLNDPATEAKYMAAMALKRQVVSTNAQKTAVIWNNKDRGVICHIPTGQKALFALGEFLLDKENLVTLQTIGEKLGLSESKPKEKSKSKAKAA